MYNFIFSGGGTKFIDEWFMAGGRSKDTIGFNFPYSTELVDSILLERQQKYCSSTTSQKMAVTAFLEGKKLGLETTGVGASFSLHKKNQREGRDNGGWLSIISEGRYLSEYIKLDNTNTSREKQEEELVYRIYNKLSNFVYNSKTFTFNQVEDELIFPGSFNPIHSGHINIANFCEKKFGKKVIFEISLNNFEKPVKDFTCLGLDIHKVITNAPNFRDKIKVLGSGKTFIIGLDTLVRIPYSDDDYFKETGTKFIVFNRKMIGDYSRKNYSDRSIYTFIEEDEFPTSDISSTRIRNGEII